MVAPPQATVELLGRNDISCSSEFLWEVLWSELKAERESVTHVSTLWWLAVRTQTTHRMWTHTGQIPESPGVCWQAATVSTTCRNYYFYSLCSSSLLSPKCLSVVFPFLHPLPHSPFFPILCFSSCFIFFPQLHCVDNSPSVLCLVPSSASKSLHSALLRPVKCSETTAVAVRHVWIRLFVCRGNGSFCPASFC